MLSQNEKKQLKALAAKESTKYQIGKKEVTDSLIAMLDKALTARELVKIDVMRGADDPILELAYDLSAKLHAEIVQVVGKVIVLYRKNKENPKIKLAK